jgi:hypothetical protein
MILTESKEKYMSKAGLPAQRLPIDPGAFYSVADISRKDSPYYLCSQSKVFKALRRKDLKANYLNRRILLKGSAILAWISGEGGEQ